jgi:hypothetical protein
MPRRGNSQQAAAPPHSELYLAWQVRKPSNHVQQSAVDSSRARERQMRQMRQSRQARRCSMQALRCRMLPHAALQRAAMRCHTALLHGAATW